MRGILILINCLTEAIFGMVVACADTIVNPNLTGFGITLQDCLRQGKRLTEFVRSLKLLSWELRCASGSSACHGNMRT